MIRRLGKYRSIFVAGFFVVAFAAISPAQTITSILNAASYSNVVAPGSYVSIFGTGLAASAVSAQVAPYPTLLNGVSVTIGGVAAPLQYVSPTQVNALVPFEAGDAGGEPVYSTVILTTAGIQSKPFTIVLFRAAPAIFTKDYSGWGEALAFDGSFKPITTVGNEPIVLYATGLGPTYPAAETSQLGASIEPFNRIIDSLDVTIGGYPAKVLFAGLAPGLHGIYQLNVQPPPTNGNSLSLTVGGRQSSHAVTLPILSGNNVRNVSGSIVPLYPCAGAVEVGCDPATTTILNYSALLTAAKSSFAFDIAPNAKPFEVTSLASSIPGGTALRITIDPIANTWIAAGILPTAEARIGDFRSANFLLLDFQRCLPPGVCYPFAFNSIPSSRLDPAEVKTNNSFPFPSSFNLGSPGNEVWQASGILPADGHITLQALGLPANYGGYGNQAYRPGTYTVVYSLWVDSFLFQKTANYIIP